jgi:hypothetical protein
VLLDLFVEDVVHLHRRRDPALVPLHAQRRVHERVGVREAVVGGRQHVAPERLVRVVDAEAAHDPAGVDVQARVDAVGRGQRDLVGRVADLAGLLVEHLGVVLPRVVDGRADLVRELVVERQLDAAVADRAEVQDR